MMSVTLNHASQRLPLNEREKFFSVAKTLVYESKSYRETTSKCDGYYGEFAPSFKTV